MTNDRVINIQGVHNIRDLGGLVGLDGRKIVKDRLIRSSRLIQMQEDGFEYFGKINLTMIMDLRTSMEADVRPDPEVAGAKNIRIRVLSEDPKEMGAAYGMVARSKNEADSLIQLVIDGFDMGDVYLDFVNMPCACEGMSTALKLIAAQPANEAILWHCNGGKDRTGTLTAFLLTILGVSWDDILDDFEMTNQFFKDQIDYLQNLARSKTDDQRVIDTMQDIAGVSRKNMEKALNSIISQYGSIMKYIKVVLKVTDEEIQQIRDKYLEK